MDFALGTAQYIASMCTAVLVRTMTVELRRRRGPFLELGAELGGVANGSVGKSGGGPALLRLLAMLATDPSAESSWLALRSRRSFALWCSVDLFWPRPDL